jgi:hypothetical protein
MPGLERQFLVQAFGAKNWAENEISVTMQLSQSRNGAHLPVGDHYVDMQRLRRRIGFG